MLVSSAPAETEDFDVDVKASEESVRAGQPFNVTCTGPPGPGFQQQWLHPKSQARCEALGFGFLGLAPRPSCPVTSGCHVGVSLPSPARNLKLANNGSGA